MSLFRFNRLLVVQLFNEILNLGFKAQVNARQLGSRLA